MKYFHTCVEQLDMAAQQLSYQNAVADRLALILVDNIVELMVHRRCGDVFWADTMWQEIGDRKYSPSKRQEVLGEHFDPKVSFLKSLGLVTDDERIFCQNAHKFRNEAYHIGMLHEDVIHELAWNYHGLACELFSRILPTPNGAGHYKELPPSVVKHIPKTPLRSSNIFSTLRIFGHDLSDKATLIHVSKSLSELRPPAMQTLSCSLTAHD